jgi:hypothetical protein
VHPQLLRRLAPFAGAAGDARRRIPREELKSSDDLEEHRVPHPQVSPAIGGTLSAQSESQRAVDPHR